MAQIVISLTHNLLLSCSPDQSDAQKICQDALEDEEEMQGAHHKDDKYFHVYCVMMRPKMLDSLDFDNHIQQLQEMNKGKNIKEKIYFIKEELECPFRDPRDQDYQIGNKELFYMLTGQTEQTFRKYQLAVFEVQKV